MPSELYPVGDLADLRKEVAHAQTRSLYNDGECETCASKQQQQQSFFPVRKTGCTAHATQIPVRSWFRIQPDRHFVALLCIVGSSLCLSTLRNTCGIGTRTIDEAPRGA